MPTLYRDTGYSLTHLIEDIRHGNVALPDIQRPFVWSSAKVRDLFDSMYRGYPRRDPNPDYSWRPRLGHRQAVTEPDSVTDSG